jgi:hypothetical protein
MYKNIDHKFFDNIFFVFTFLPHSHTKSTHTHIQVGEQGSVFLALIRLNGSLQTATAATIKINQRIFISK